MTKARAAVLEILNAASEPLSASGVLRSLPEGSDQVTVYRTLHYLEERGFASSFILHCESHGTERYYSAAGRECRHWFHCEQCHRFTDLGACALDGLVGEYERSLGLEVRSHMLTLSGLCSGCRRSGQCTAGDAAGHRTPASNL
ncbi:MAG TPA: transcriptional repressor [Treponemataceae bacterium]|nr:MAG: zinc uptake transcriptional repressor [Spirochaetes bacterium ADurb.Bin269]HOC30207.1 transcriptional repressor [Treponemataceae bacterium]HQL33490.1 transcriptional repressor [Treponemataceae bacterium]